MTAITRRCHFATIDNPLPSHGRPVITFRESDVAVVGGKTFVDPLPAAKGVEFEPERQFPMLDPETNEPTGVIATHAELYAMLYSLYRDAAKNVESQA